MKHSRRHEQAVVAIRQYLTARRVVRFVDAVGWGLIAGIAWAVLGWSLFGSR